jgi:polysaccharide export outer membrane protein
MVKFLLRPLTPLLLALLAGCGLNSIDLPPIPTQADMAYRLDTGDKVAVTVFGQTDLSGQYDVGADGAVMLPLIGKLPVRGLTVDEVAATAGERYGKVMVQPKVTADIATYRSVYVLGEVNHAGNFAFIPGLRVQQAIAIAGGFTRRAITDRIVLVRPSASGDLKRYAVGLSDLIQPGDTLDIQRRIF